MKKVFADISIHMASFGCSLLAKAAHEATFFEMGFGQHAFALVTAAHATEILIKAAIAQEHPLLIFEKIPSIVKKDDLLDELFEKGKTVKYTELPNLLYLTTNYKIIDQNYFIIFGKLRNRIIHSGIKTNIDYSIETIKFSVEVVNPIIKHFWDASLFEGVATYDELTPEYLIAYCIEHHIKLKIPRDLDLDMDFYFPELNIDLNSMRE
jgi:hypothetical protein